MTLAHLGRVSGVSIRSITAFENAHKVPTRETVVLLARALEVPVAFLEAPDLEEIPVGSVSFRALSKMTAIQRDAALSAGRIAISISDWVEARFRLPSVDVPTFPHLDPEQAAEQLRARWGLGEAPIVNMIHLLEAHGIRVFSLASDCRSVDAFCTRSNGTPFVFLNTGKSGERGRFDAAHELGHLVLHSEHRTPQGPDAEREAQRFASSFLMPRAGIVAQMLRNASTPRIVSAKRRWKVSAMSLTYRLHELGLLSDWGYRTATKQLSQLGYRRSEPDGIPRETSQLLARVFAVLRSEKIKISDIAAEMSLTVDELNLHLFRLVPTALVGGSKTTEPMRTHLRAVGAEPAAELCRG